MIFRQFGDLRRVDKRIARKLYNEGKDVMFCPCNMRPDHTFGMGILENKDWLGNEGNKSRSEPKKKPDESNLK